MTNIEQFAVKVVNFSSQYGTAGTSSYTASNLAANLNVYPKYGDYTEAFVLRTYGQWWQECPSARKRFRHQPGSSQDFVELQYKTSVIPTSIRNLPSWCCGQSVGLQCRPKRNDYKEIRRSGYVLKSISYNFTRRKFQIFATCLVNILSMDPDDILNNFFCGHWWVTLWSGQSQCHSIPKEARVFTPPIKKIEFATNLIRLEFNSVDCDYYTELDAVKLVGVTPNSVKTTRDRREGFQISLTTKLIKQLSLTDRQTSIGSEDEHDEFEKWGYFGILPDEVIQHIFQYLDKVSLANVAQTCSLLLKNSYDPLLYCELDLQSHWNTVDDVALEGITSRCYNLQHLNLSWTGGGGQVTEEAFCSFIEECGQNLLTLRLACCQYIKKGAMEKICKICSKLEELDLSCVGIKENATLLSISQLTQLKYLNLYSTTLSPPILQTISKLRRLEHLNLGACATTTSGNQLEAALNDCLKGLPKLISLDLWRCKFASLETINILAKYCQDLQELDIGWCHRISRDFWDPTDFLSKCYKLKKLFLTCGRSISDYHLQEIAKYCCELEQLDILGTNKVTIDGVSMICRKCQKLSFFDVSFCSCISEETIKSLNQLFPKVCFKRSFN